ncbi:MAG TPA: hypothetical protein VFN76_06175 [Candidatus Limnocylindria bacterium]|nr:hypothetical protein [Candidatus Limnocylindria bacterium]
MATSPSIPSRGARVNRWVLLLAALAIAAAIWFASRPTLAAVLGQYGLSVFDGVQVDDETWIGVRSTGPRGAEAIYVDDNFTTGWSAGRSGTVNEEIDDGAVIGMFGAGGEDTLGWSTFLYGIGPPGTTEIAVAGNHAVGYVTDPAASAFVVVSREEVLPDTLHYFLLDAQGRILFDGTGLVATDLQ